MSEAISSGIVTYTRTGGANDTSSPYNVSLAGSELNTGTFSLGALTNAPTLVNGAVYSIAFSGTDAAGNQSTTVTVTGITYDITAPTITSGVAGTNKVENSGAGQTIYTITASDNVGATSFAIGGTDAGLLSVNAGSGVVSLTADPNYETKNSYSFTATASDATGNTSAATTVTFAITNVDEVVPTITSGTSGTNLVENSGAGQTVYSTTADANDGGTIASFAIGGDDAGSMTFDTSTGVVKLTADPNYEAKTSYSFTVTATDAAGTSAATTVTFAITNVDETAPSITSGTTGTNLAENSGAGSNGLLYYS